MLNNIHLLVDYGNSYIKAGLYDSKIDKFIETIKIIKSTSGDEFIKSFKNKFIPKTIVVAPTASEKYTKPFVSFLSKKFKIKPNVINQKSFKNIIDLSNVDKSVVIGPDILLASYYGMQQAKKGLVLSLGSVYFGAYFNKNKIDSALLTPSLCKALLDIPNQCMINENLLPSKFDKTIGLNTKDAFSCGLNLMLGGFVQQVSTFYKIPKQNVYIFGGDCEKYESLSNYKKIDNLILKSLSLIIKDKKMKKRVENEE